MYKAGVMLGALMCNILYLFLLNSTICGGKNNQTIINLHSKHNDKIIS